MVLPLTTLPVASLTGTEPSTTTDDGCGAGNLVCRTILDWTDDQRLADWAEFLVGRPLTILLIVVVAWVLTRAAKRGIRRLGQRVRATALDMSGRSRAFAMSDEARERAERRTETITDVLNNVTGIAIWSLAFLLVLGELGVNLGPLIAGAGIAGVALGFGAQNLVKDFLSGIFMLIEDQYGVGDVVDLGEARGTVEKVGLRTTTIRDVSGTVWHVPNGQVTRVGNLSQLYARAVLDIGVGYGADIEEAKRVIKGTADVLWQDESWQDDIEAEPEMLGVQDLAADAVVLRLSVQTEAASQWKVERELRQRIKEALDAAGIEIPFAQRTVWLREESANGS